jgi:hypothetical protein
VGLVLEDELLDLERRDPMLGDVGLVALIPLQLP